MKENSFYVDTIREFKELRYKYKVLVKKHYNIMKEKMKNNDPDYIKEEYFVNLYESL